MKDETAFPVPGEPDYGTGLTKREYFAAAAMQGAIAGNKEINYDEAALEAVAFADHLIIELAKEPANGN